MVANRSHRLTGPSLALARQRVGISQAALARHLGISRSIVSRSEALAFPTDRFVERYVAALEAVIGDEPRRK